MSDVATPVQAGKPSRKTGKGSRPRKWGAIPTGAFVAEMFRHNGKSVDEFVPVVAQMSDPPVNLSTLTNDQKTEFRQRVSAKIGNVRGKLLGKLPSKRGGVALTDDERSELLAAAQNLRNHLFAGNSGKNIPPLKSEQVPRLKGASVGKRIEVSEADIAFLRSCIGM